jgi:hypothetical protein
MGGDGRRVHEWSARKKKRKKKRSVARRVNLPSIFVLAFL